MPKQPPKTKEEVKAEIQALRDAIPKTRRTNYFGDNLHDAIRAQIAVLEDDLDEGAIYDDFSDAENEEDRNELDAALDALAWREGEEREDAEHNSLAAGWLDIGLG